MRETRLSGSVEGVVSNHDPYSDLRAGPNHRIFTSRNVDRNCQNCQLTWALRGCTVNRVSGLLAESAHNRFACGQQAVAFANYSPGALRIISPGLDASPSHKQDIEFYGADTEPNAESQEPCAP